MTDPAHQGALQEPREKRRKGGELQVTFRQPFDLLAVATSAHKKRKAAGVTSGSLSENWLPFVDTYRTLCRVPPPEMKELFERLRDLPETG